MKKTILTCVGVIAISTITAIGVRAGLRALVKMKATDEEIE